MTTASNLIHQMAQAKAVSDLLKSKAPHLRLDVSVNQLTGLPDGYAIVHIDGPMLWGGPKPPTIEEVSDAYSANPTA